MAIEKSLSQAPLGHVTRRMQGCWVSQILKLRSKTLKKSNQDGDLEIEIEPGKETAEDFNANLAEYIDDSELA
jgi:hypothetical protein